MASKILEKNRYDSNNKRTIIMCNFEALEWTDRKGWPSF